MYEEKTVDLQGISQVIGLEGLDEGPLMIMLHGGPWGPIIYGHAFRNYYPTLYNNCGLVWWDQYGCGRNCAANVDENITVRDFAEMTVDLVDEIHRLFPDRKIVLNGNSFGSYLAVYAAEKRPQIVKGVIILGPITDMTKAAANFENAAKSHYTEKEKKRVDAIRDSSSIEYFSLVAETLAEKYTNCAHYKGKEAHDSLTNKWIMRWLTSKDWKLSNLIGTMKAASTMGKKYSALWNSLLQINIKESLYNLKMPVLVLQGSEELYILPEQMRKIASEIPGMTYVEYPYCGHIPTAEAFPDMLQEMVRFVKDRVI